MSILYDLRYVPFGLSVLATLLWGFYVLSQDRRDTRTLKACQLLRVRFRLGFLLLFSSHVFLSLITRVVFLALTITLETDPWTVYLLGSIICQCMISQVRTLKKRNKIFTNLISVFGRVGRGH